MTASPDGLVARGSETLEHRREREGIRFAEARARDLQQLVMVRRRARDHPRGGLTQDGVRVRGEPGGQKCELIARQTRIAHHQDAEGRRAQLVRRGCITADRLQLVVEPGKPATPRINSHRSHADFGAAACAAVRRAAAFHVCGNCSPRSHQGCRAETELPVAERAIASAGGPELLRAGVRAEGDERARGARPVPAPSRRDRAAVRPNSSALRPPSPDDAKPPRPRPCATSLSGARSSGPVWPL